MRIVAVDTRVPDRLVELMKKAYHLIRVDSHLLICPTSMWDKMRSTTKDLVQDVTSQHEYHFQERSMILVKEIVKSAQIVDSDKVRIKPNSGKEFVGKLLMSGGECPFCSEPKLTFTSVETERTTVCLACNRKMVIINSDSIQDFQTLFPDIYKIV
ncbi:MAG: hypothetical protein WED04_07350 [Promethearchaeati archaeon SRVP18_Atabeyarchaeia-1]